MARPFTKPAFIYHINKKKEIKAIKDLQKKKIPYGVAKPRKNQLLVGSWNIANFDIQKRTNACYDIISQIIKPFDLMAVQEVNADMRGLRYIMKTLKKTHACVFSDTGGNTERMTYIYRPKKVKLLNHIGELTIPPSNRRSLKFDGKSVKFRGYDRPSYLASWKFNSTIFTTYNSHIYYGNSSKKSYSFRQRILEVYSLTSWIENLLRKGKDEVFSHNILLLGDFNVPRMERKDPVYKRLKRKNLTPLRYHEHIGKGSAIDTDATVKNDAKRLRNKEIMTGSNISNDAHYDQLVVSEPFSKKIKVSEDHKAQIFAWDNAVFKDLYNSKTGKQFRAYAKWAISDHRVIWSLFDMPK